MIGPMLFWTKLNHKKMRRACEKWPLKVYYAALKHCKMSAMRASREPSKLLKSRSFRGLCPLDPRRGFAPAPHQGPLSGPLDPTPLYAPLALLAPLKLVNILSSFIVRSMLLTWLRACTCTYVSLNIDLSVGLYYTFQRPWD